jgi:hypothetical protein
MSPMRLLANAAGGQFTALKRKKAPRGATGGMSPWTSRRAAGISMGRRQSENEVVLDPRADADELTLMLVASPDAVVGALAVRGPARPGAIAATF